MAKSRNATAVSYAPRTQMKPAQETAGHQLQGSLSPQEAAAKELAGGDGLMKENFGTKALGILRSHNEAYDMVLFSDFGYTQALTNHAHATHLHAHTRPFAAALAHLQMRTSRAHLRCRTCTPHTCTPCLIAGSGDCAQDDEKALAMVVALQRLGVVANFYVVANTSNAVDRACLAKGTLQAINARDIPVAVGSDANQKSKTRMLKDGTITATGGLKFAECLYLAQQGELYRGGTPDTLLTLTLTTHLSPSPLNRHPSPHQASPTWVWSSSSRRSPRPRRQGASSPSPAPPRSPIWRSAWDTLGGRRRRRAW